GPDQFGGGRREKDAAGSPQGHTNPGTSRYLASRLPYRSSSSTSACWTPTPDSVRDQNPTFDSMQVVRSHQGTEPGRQGRTSRGRRRGGGAREEAVTIRSGCAGEILQIPPGGTGPRRVRGSINPAGVGSFRPGDGRTGRLCRRSARGERKTPRAKSSTK